MQTSGTLLQVQRYSRQLQEEQAAFGVAQRICFKPFHELLANPTKRPKHSNMEYVGFMH